MNDLSPDPFTVSLVIPGRDAARTLRTCLEAATALLGRDGLIEIIFVDDGSTDATAAIAAEFPVQYLRASGRGPAHARNVGWRRAVGDLVWFIDSDCVPAPDALARLRARINRPEIAAVGGSYGNREPDSWLAVLIHEEIIERHRRMPLHVDFLATFNVLYRRSALEAVGGFDESFVLAQDAELAYRMKAARYDLLFDPKSTVEHYHPTRWMAYLKKQIWQGFWRANLYKYYPNMASGDSYSSTFDHLQPPVMLALLLLTPTALWAPARPFLLGLGVVALLLPVPMTARLIRRTGRPAFLAFIPFSLARAIGRGFGFARGCVATAHGAPRPDHRDVLFDTEAQWSKEHPSAR